MADISKAISANDIKNGTSITGVDVTGNVQSYFDTANDRNTPAIADIQNKYSSRFDDITYYFHHGLSKNLEVYYRLDEESGIRYESVGDKHLTDNNTVGYATGVSSKTETGADFVRANTEYLSLANASLGYLSPGDTDFSIACWIKLDASDIASNQHIFGVWNITGNNREYLIWWHAGHTKFRFYTSGDGATSSSKLITDSTFSADTWYHLVFVHDATNNQRQIYVNGTLDNSDSYSDGVYQGNGDFNIGRTQNTNDRLDGKVDEWGIWSRVLSAEDASDLYNDGNGRKAR